MEEENGKVLVKDDSVTVTYDDKQALGRIIWHGNPTLESYKNAFESLIDYGKAGNPVISLITDTRQQGIIGPGMRKWFEQEAMPQAKAGGLKRVAAISDANVFKKYYLNLLLNAVSKSGLAFKLVSDEKAAKEFLFDN